MEVDPGAVAMRLIAPILTMLAVREPEALDRIEGQLRSEQKNADDREAAEIDAALELVTSIRH